MERYDMLTAIQFVALMMYTVFYAVMTVVIPDVWTIVF